MPDKRQEQCNDTQVFHLITRFLATTLVIGSGRESFLATDAEQPGTHPVPLYLVKRSCLYLCTGTCVRFTERDNYGANADAAFSFAAEGTCSCGPGILSITSIGNHSCRPAAILRGFSTTDSSTA